MYICIYIKYSIYITYIILYIILYILYIIYAYVFKTEKITQFYVTFRFTAFNNNNFT